MTSLVQHSIRVILANQAPTGAFPASPTFPTYRYAWFRDGAFIAYAMDVVGQHQSAHRFHEWVARTVLRHAGRAERAILKAEHRQPLGEDYLHTRYTVEGEEGREDWPNFQLDGLGTWLWSLAEHLRRTSAPLPLTWVPAVDVATRYLATLWPYPCYDLWEEHPQHFHPYTLAAIYAGLRAGQRLLAANAGENAVISHSLAQVADQVCQFLLQQGVQEGYLAKYFDHKGRPYSGVDASLVGVATPYRLLQPGDPVMQATVARIEADLCYPGGGVYRYREDTYYGGGEWVLLAAWLGWYYADLGKRERAGELLRWVESQADAEGHLPEQVSDHPLAAEHHGKWVARWGPVARPLLWSHAMYLILHDVLRR